MQSASTAAIVDHLVEGIETRRILGAAWTPSGDVTMMTAEDARRELDIAGVDAATGVESCLLNVPVTSSAKAAFWRVSCPSRTRAASPPSFVYGLPAGDVPGRGAPTPRPQRGPAVPVTQSGPRRPRPSTGPAPAAPQKAQRYSLRSQGPRGTQ